MALYGADVSIYTAVGVQGQDFTIIRATYGTGFVDSRCDLHYQLAKQQNKLRGIYHVGYNRLNTAVDEANWYVDNIQGYIGDALLGYDNERWVAKNGAIQHDPTDVNWALAWLDQVYTRTKVRPVIYMSASVLAAADWTPVVKAGYALWCAGYPNAFNIANPPTPRADGADMPYDTHAWPFAVLWQYSSSGGALDRDIFYGTADAWHKFAQGDRNAQPTPAPEPSPAPTSSEPTPVTSDPAPSTGDTSSAEPTPTPVQPEPTTPAPTAESPAPQPKPVAVTVEDPWFKRLLRAILAMFGIKI